MRAFTQNTINNQLIGRLMAEIVLLEKDTLSTGDMDFTPFERLGKVAYYDTLKGDDLINAVKDAEIVLINKTLFNKELFDACKRLKYIGIFATGFNNVDLKIANERNITVCNVPSYSTESVAQLAMTFILSLASNVAKYDESTHAGKWIESSTFSYFPFKFSELSGKTLGVFGMGEIGESVTKKAQSFGMKVIACTRTKKIVDGVEFVEKDELFKRSDFLTLHCPLNPQTEKVVNERTLALMKPTAFLINTSRGGVIDEKALANALTTKIIAGCALDVLTKEPMDENCPLFNLPNCIITPHIAWTTVEARKRLLVTACKNVEAFLNGKTQNSVNGKA